MKNSLILLLLMGVMVPIGWAEEVYPSEPSKLGTDLPFANRAPGSLTTLYNAQAGSGGNFFDIEPLFAQRFNDVAAHHALHATADE